MFGQINSGKGVLFYAHDRSAESDANSFAALLQTLLAPIMFLSGIMLPLTLAPPLLQTIGLINPFAYVVEAARHLFLGNLTDVSIVQGFVMMGVLMLLALLWGKQSFNGAAA